MLLDYWLALVDVPPREPPPPAPVFGNALATYYSQPTFMPLPKKCLCGKSRRPSKACPAHCHLIEARQHHEDELVVLALV